MKEASTYRNKNANPSENELMYEKKNICLRVNERFKNVRVLLLSYLQPPKRVGAFSFDSFLLGNFEFLKVCTRSDFHISILSIRWYKTKYMENDWKWLKVIENDWK